MDKRLICKQCIALNGECLIELGACPIHDYGDDISTATYKELQEQNQEIKK